MKTMLIALVAATTMSFGSVAFAGGNKVVKRVHVGGHDVLFEDCDGSCSRHFSLVALEFADGRVIGQYDDRWNPHDGFHAVIDCLSIIGNEAWVSGWITHGNMGGEDMTGLPVATRVQDNGKSKNDPVDMISFSWVGDPRPCTDYVEYELLEMPKGQVVVKEK